MTHRSSRRPSQKASSRVLRAPLILGALAVFLAACGGGKGVSQRHTGPVPVTQGGYKVGSPYKINGNWYRPQEDWAYDEVGEASWYGYPFHGRKTANGETFNKRALTAAHPTLPMPTRVKVTNLSNGKSVIVRVNDRGPFARGRIIDLSERTAEVLGFKNQGVAQVRVQMLGKAPVRIARHDEGSSLDVSDATFAIAEAQPAQPALAPAPNPNRPAPYPAPGAAQTPPQSPAMRTPDYSYAPQSPVQPGPRPLAGSSYGQPETAPQSSSVQTAGISSQAIEAPASEDREPRPLVAAGFAVLPRKAPPAPAAPIAEAAVSATQPVAKPVRPLFVQAGAFASPETADKLRETLEAMGTTPGSVSVTPVETEVGQLYRVRVGPMASAEEADLAKRQLSVLGHTEAQIVVD